MTILLSLVFCYRKQLISGQVFCRMRGPREEAASCGWWAKKLKWSGDNVYLFIYLIFCLKQMLSFFIYYFLSESTRILCLQVKNQNFPQGEDAPRPPYKDLILFTFCEFAGVIQTNWKQNDILTCRRGYAWAGTCLFGYLGSPLPPGHCRNIEVLMFKSLRLFHWPLSSHLQALRICKSGTQAGLLFVSLFYRQSLLQLETRPQTLTCLHVWDSFHLENNLCCMVTTACQNK